MNNKVIVDTSIWIEYFNRPESEAGNSLEELIKNGKVYVSGIILTELLQGARLEKEFNAILENFVVLPFLDMTIETWIRAGRISYQLRRKGVTIPTTDLIIASLAIEYDSSIFTMDPHFKKIPDLKLYAN